MAFHKAKCSSDLHTCMHAIIQNTFWKCLQLQAFCLPKCSKHSLEMSATASILFTEMPKTQSGNVCSCKHSVYRNAQNTVWICLQLQAFCLPKCSKHSLETSAPASILFTEMLCTGSFPLIPCGYPSGIMGFFFIKKLKLSIFTPRLKKGYH